MSHENHLNYVWWRLPFPTPPQKNNKTPMASATYKSRWTQLNLD
jgi:hypothetical protein